MIRLSDLLLESTPAEEAERMGLERKPGFGNYGPKNSDEVTHRSRGGKLVPVADTKGTGVGRGGGKAVPSGRPTPPKKEEPPPPKVTPVPPKAPQAPPQSTVSTNGGATYKARADERGGARKLANLLDTMPESPLKAQMTDVLKDRTTAGYVRGVRDLLKAKAPDDIRVVDTPYAQIPPNFTDVERDVTIRPYAVPDGVFDSQNRNIWLHPTRRRDWENAQGMAPRSWEHHHVLASHVLTHEVIHSASPRTHPDGFVSTKHPWTGEVITGVPIFGMSRDLIEMEEAMTEVIARDISKTSLAAQGVVQAALQDKEFKAYDDYVIPARLMATYGGLDIYKNFFDVTDPAVLRKNFQAAEDTMIRDFLWREVGATEYEINDVLDAVSEYEFRELDDVSVSPDGYTRVYRKKFAMFHPKFLRMMLSYVNVARLGNYDEIAQVPPAKNLTKALQVSTSPF